MSRLEKQLSNYGIPRKIVTTVNFNSGHIEQREFDEFDVDRISGLENKALVSFEEALKQESLGIYVYEAKYDTIKLFHRFMTADVANSLEHLTKNKYAGPYFKSLTKQQQEYLETNEINWLDVGCHAGSFGNMVLKMFPNHKCLFLDGMQVNVSLAEASSKLNDIHDRSLFVDSFYGAVVGNEFNDSTVTMHATYRTTGNAGIYPHPTRLQFKVPALNFEQVVRDHDITAVKLDVEGAEYEIITEANELSELQFLFLEYHIVPEDGELKIRERYSVVYEKLISEFDSVIGITPDEIGKNRSIKQHVLCCNVN